MKNKKELKITLTRSRNFQVKNVSKVPVEPGVYVLIGTRGVVTYVGQDDYDLRERLTDILSTGRAPADKFRYEIIHEDARRLAAQQVLLHKYSPTHNAGLDDRGVSTAFRYGHERSGQCADEFGRSSLAHRDRVRDTEPVNTRIDRAREVLAKLDMLKAEVSAYETRVSIFLAGGP